MQVSLPELVLAFKAPTLEVARMVAGAAGYTDVDIEPMEPGRVKVTAVKGDKVLRIIGETVQDVCGKLIGKLRKEL